MRKVKLSKLKFVKAPVGCSEYLTEGKIYKVSDYNLMNGFYIIADNSPEAFILVGRYCSHAEGNWIPCDDKGNDLSLIV